MFTLAPPLAALVGAPTMSRPAVVKAIWEYVRKHDLAKPTDRRFIICDAKIKAIFDNSVRACVFVA